MDNLPNISQHSHPLGIATETETLRQRNGKVIAVAAEEVVVLPFSLKFHRLNNGGELLGRETCRSGEFDLLVECPTGIGTSPITMIRNAVFDASIKKMLTAFALDGSVTYTDFLHKLDCFHRVDHPIHIEIHVDRGWHSHG